MGHLVLYDRLNKSIITNVNWIKEEDITSLENYIRDYYQQILKRLKEMEADLNIEEKKRLPF